MDIENFRDKRLYRSPVHDHLIFDLIKNKRITKRIIEIPQEIQRIIYILVIKKYWKDITIYRPIRPIWADYIKYLDNQLKLSVIDNLHFMHLDFNTLPENKKWIPGCSCEFCQDYRKTHPTKVNVTLNKILEDEFYFPQILGCYDILPNKWNQYESFYGGPDNLTKTIIFDPLKDQFENKVSTSPHESPIYFSYELQNYNS